MSTPRFDNDLTRLLHEGDPLVQDPGLTAQERGDMRRTVLSQVPKQAQSLWRQLSPALGVAVLLTVALGIAWWPRSIDSPVAVPEPFGEAATRTGDSLDNRKIQFETPGGTLVVWVLNPNFPS